MQEGTQSFHDKQHPNGSKGKDNKTHYQDDHIVVPVTSGKSITSQTIRLDLRELKYLLY